MNLYKITYTLDGEEHYDHITERTEKSAQKRLRGRYKTAEITDTELVSTDAPATKEQEREALETIRALLAELGPQSYLRTAFEGCLEDAEQNIEDDAAYSYKARYELAEEKLRQMGGDYNALKRDMNLLQGQADAAQEQIAALTKRQLPERLRLDLLEMTTSEAQASRARMAEAADKMAAGADNPACVLFKDSVTIYRAEKARAEEMEQRAAELGGLEGGAA